MIGIPLIKILLLKYRNIGDVLLATALIDNLKSMYPDSEIDFSVNKGCEEMLTLNPEVNKVICYDRQKVKKKSFLARIAEEVRFALRIRKHHYDLVINLTEGERGALLAFFSGAKKKLGYKVRRGIFSKVKVFDAIANDKVLQHTVNKDLQFIQLLGGKIKTKKVGLFFSATSKNKIDGLLKEHGINGFVHLHPVSRWMFKCWSDERMAEIIDYIYQVKGGDVVVTSSQDKIEMERVHNILELCKSEPISFSGQLSLKELASLSARSDLFLGVDSAPMHMAAALNVPVIALFGASEPIIWGPWNNDMTTQRDYQNKDGVQENGRHHIISNMDHTLYFKKGIKRSVGMDNISAEQVKGVINECAKKYTSLF